MAVEMAGPSCKLEWSYSMQLRTIKQPKENLPGQAFEEAGDVGKRPWALTFERLRFKFQLHH